ncbi:MAG: flagellar biosynthetic protein FliR [Pseudazoarcus pumilus]|nr:flagellar biosynthetic protein FliR [Pseudazoarcus pumilus]
MLAVTAAQLDTWLAALMFPLVRLLGLFASAPLWSNRGIPVRIRLAAGLAMAMAVLPALPPMPAVPTDSWEALAILAHQFIIGAALGFMMRLFFAAVDLAGEMIGLQMGLSFAVFFSPTTGGQSSVIAEFLGLITLLVFLALDGHLMLVQVLVHTFEWLPVGEATSSQGWLVIVRHASVMFAAGVMMALPMVATLLIANIGLGILTRAAPQLNLFAVGFPVTLTVGFIVLLLSLSILGPMLQRLFEYGFNAVDALLRALGGV